MANTPTTNYSLLKPASGDTGWGTTMNTNLDLLDAALTTIAAGVGDAGDMLKATYDPDANGVIAIAQGGTNAATAAGALVNLGAAASAGLAGGQTLYGGTGANDNLTLASTSHSTKGYVLLAPLGGRVGIGTSAPASTLDVSGFQMLFGADGGASTRTNTTAKYGALAVAHYTNAEEPIGVLYGQSEDTFSMLHFGGGTAAVNAAMYVAFYTAADTTTTTGTLRMRINSDGNVLIGTTGAADSRLHVEGTHGASGTVLQLLTLTTGYGSAAGAGFGGRILWELKSSTTADRAAATDDVLWATATDASRAARRVMSVYDTAARECIRMEASGSAAMLGFFGANATAKPTGVAVDAAGIHAALVTLGLIAA